MQVPENLDDLLTFVKCLGVGRRPLDDPFLKKSHQQCKVLKRVGVINEGEEELFHRVMEKFNCNACTAVFKNLFEYELHYNSCHYFECTECKKICPSAKLLEMHVQETHDSFFQVLAERQPMFQCFVSQCKEKFKDPSARRDHCRKIHLFPKNYRYDTFTKKKLTPKDCDTEEKMETDLTESEKKVKLRIQFGNSHKQKTFQNLKPPKKNCKEKESNCFVDTKSEAFIPSATMFIPRQVQRKFNAKTSENKQINLMELEESLPDIK